MIDDELVQWLVDHSTLSAEKAREVARYVRKFDDRRGPEARVLWQHKRSGKDATVDSIYPGNIVLDWERAVTEAIPSLVAGSVAALATPFAPAAALAALVTALVALYRVSRVELSGDHYRVVCALYVDHKARNPVPIEALIQGLTPALPADRVQGLLDDLSEMRIIQFDEFERVIKRRRFFSS